MNPMNLAAIFLSRKSKIAELVREKATVKMPIAKVKESICFASLKLWRNLNETRTILSIMNVNQRGQMTSLTQKKLLKAS